MAGQKTKQIKSETTPTEVAPAPVADKKTKAPKKAETEATVVVAPVEEAQPKTKQSKKSKKEEVEVVAVAPVAPVAPVEEAKPKKGKKAKTVEPEPEVEEEVEQTAGGHKKRYFRCVYKNKEAEIVEVGRYSGIKPKQAASKALSAIIKKTKLKIGEPVKYLIQECTRGSKKKKYSYVGQQAQLDSKLIFKISPKTDDDGKVVLNEKTGKPKVVLTKMEEADYESEKKKLKKTWDKDSKNYVIYHKQSEVKKISLSEVGDLVHVDLAQDEVAIPEEVEEPKLVKKGKAKALAPKKGKAVAKKPVTKSKGKAKAE
jgi:hypothetical protein